MMGNNCPVECSTPISKLQEGFDEPETGQQPLLLSGEDALLCHSVQAAMWGQPEHLLDTANTGQACGTGQAFYQAFDACPYWDIKNVSTGKEVENGSLFLHCSSYDHDPPGGITRGYGHGLEDDRIPQGSTGKEHSHRGVRPQTIRTSCLYIIGSNKFRGANALRTRADAGVRLVRRTPPPPTRRLPPVVAVQKFTASRWINEVSRPGRGLIGKRNPCPYVRLSLSPRETEACAYSSRVDTRRCALRRHTHRCRRPTQAPGWPPSARSQTFDGPMPSPVRVPFL